MIECCLGILVKKKKEKVIISLRTFMSSVPRQAFSKVFQFCTGHGVSGKVLFFFSDEAHQRARS